MADCLSGWVYPAGKAWMTICMHHDAEETAEANGITEVERFLEEGEDKCFLVKGSRAEQAQVREAKVQAVEAQITEEEMIRAIKGVQSVLREHWSEHYAKSDH